MVEKNNKGLSTYRIEVRGLVQGVGFRPFIYKTAADLGISGWVENRNDGVLISATGIKKEVEEFAHLIRSNAPLASSIEEIYLSEDQFVEYDDFSIRSSSNVSDAVTEISPDIAVCDQCLVDMQEQAHRIDYPFINCTHCGPRYSIIRDLPYDRSHTTMDPFHMCPTCRREYENIYDRRFHAQPVACNDCGPQLTLKTKEKTITPILDIIKELVEGIVGGKTYSVKGIGGYHLICDAFNEEAVAALRAAKQRDGKPFALLFRDVKTAGKIVHINKEEHALLHSWQRPIVLLKKKAELAKGIADGLDSLGVMLPYMPFHHLLFKELTTDAVVLTSCNRSQEPLLLSEEEVERHFGDRVDGILSYNREIFNRNDDSVVTSVHGKPQVLRRARGYAPLPLRSHMYTEGIFAAGAELVNSFCIGKDKNALMSQYIGDLQNLETLNFYEEVYERFCRMFRFSPELIVHDLHPDYLSTQFALRLAESREVPVIAVQHHHAHIASVMLANKLEGEVIGFALDGLGFGEDGNIWGAELMIADYTRYRRLFHFEYMPLPGGDKANKEPWRMAVAYLYKVYGSEFQNLPLPMFNEIKHSDISGILQLIDRSVNAPSISSTGRLFDAVAAILGINYVAAFQAEAPMLLESLSDPDETGVYAYEIQGTSISFVPMIRAIVEDVLNGTGRETIAAKFHNTLIDIFYSLAVLAQKEAGLNRVVLSGGSFQNRILTEKLMSKLAAKGFNVYLPGTVPVSDQGIALGQLAIGAAKRMKTL
ncbi:carbamoyltransferase HypF [Bacteroidota bacterium]